MRLFLDTCVIDLMSELGTIEVSSETAGLELAMTPDLQREYQATLLSGASEKTKILTRSILKAASVVSFFGFAEEGSNDMGPCLGWDEGIWASMEQLRCMDAIRVSDRRRPTGIPLKRTDAYLVAFGQTDIVLTANRKERHWDTAPSGQGAVVQWSNLRMDLSATNFKEALAATIRYKE